jgi:hypothetical protein
MRTWTSIAPAILISLALSASDAATISQTKSTPPPAPPPPATRVYPPGSDEAGIAEFEKQVAAYVGWRKTTAGSIDAKQRETASQAEIAAKEKALGDQVRKSRVQAKPGDIFNKTAAAVFRRIIMADYKARTPQKKRLADDEVPTFTITINQTYPSTFPLATFPATILSKIPKLPEQVEYRIVANHLILRDTEANVIVDYVPNVVP